MISRRRGSQSRRSDRRDAPTAGGRRCPAWLGAKVSAGPRSLARRGAPSSLSMASALSGFRARSLSQRSWLPAVRASVRPMRCCAGAESSSAGRFGLGARHGPREIVGGDRGRGRANRRFVARCGSRRRAPGRSQGAGCVSQSRSSGKHARSRRSLDFSGGRFAARARCLGLPPRLCASLSLADRTSKGRRQFFSADAGALLLCPAQAPVSFPRPGHLCIAKQKNWRRPSSALLRPAPTPYGRRSRVQVRSQGQAFRDRTEGNKPASGRRNPRPRKSGSRS